MKKNQRKMQISSYIEEYFLKYDAYPTERDIAAGTGIPRASTHRLLIEMDENGELSFNGRRSARTENLERVGERVIMPVLGYVACGPGQEEEEQLLEYIYMSESMIGHGSFFALIAKGESMTDAGIYPGDYVIVRKQQTARPGDYVIALLDGKNNLKLLALEDGQYILRSCNQNRVKYPDIIPQSGEELRIQGIVVGLYHSLQSWG